MVNNPTVSVIIPVFNGSEHIRTCLRAVFESDYRDFECIVVNDGSKDDTLSILKDFQVNVLTFPNTNGQAYARNRGVEASKGQILLFVDADVVIRPDTITRVIETFEKMPTIDAIFGSYDDEPGAPNFFSQYKNLFHHYVHQHSNVDASTFWCGCGSIKRETFIKIGGFNAKLLAIEDIEFGYKLKARQYNIYLNKDIQVKHLKRYSFFGMLMSDIFYRAIPWSTLMLSSGNTVNDLNTRTDYKVSLGIVALLTCSIPFAGTWWGLSLIALLSMGFYLLHRDFYSFFVRRRGLLFALKVAPLHLLYYLYSGLSFIFSVLNFFVKKKKLRENYERDSFSKFVYIK
jgi:glycosyltransferase involved in cell wall biosynthesis